MGKPLVITALVVGALAATTTPSPTYGLSTSPKTTVVQDISSAQPPGLQPACQDGASNPDSDVVERAPQIAVNPVDPSDIVAVFEQGNRNHAWDATGEQGDETVITADVSGDGGTTWQQGIVPDLDCRSGAPAPAYGPVAEPNLEFGPDGTLYLTTTGNARAVDAGTITPAPGIQVSTSRDGGRTWGEPTAIDVGDRGVLAPDPLTAGTAYLAYDQPLGEPGDTVVFRTLHIDGSTVTASPPSVVLPAGPDGARALAQAIGVLADGTIVIVVLEATPFVTARILAMTSHDHGATWSLPVQIAECDPDFPKDHEVGGPVVYGGPAVYGFASPSLATSGGRVYVTWTNLKPDLTDGTDPYPSFGQVAVASSTDGTTWSTPPAIVNPPLSQQHQVMESRVAVAGDGTVGVVYYDLRNDHPDDDELTADLWFAQSSDGGAHWSETHVAGPFDLREVGPAAMSTYIDLTAGRSGFEIAFALGSPTSGSPAIEGAVDILRAHVKV